MQFSDTSTSLGLLQDITFLLSGVDTTNYATADRTRNINERFRMVWSMIFESYGGWLFVDNNVSDSSTFPYAEATWTINVQTVGIPAAALTVRQVSILNSGGTRENLRGLSHEEFFQLGGDSVFTTAATPRYYILYGDMLRLLPAPNYAATNGIRIYFDQDISVFAATDTTKTPGFALPFHRMLSVGAALDYALARGLTQKAVFLQNLWSDYEKRLRDYYAKRFTEQYPHSILPRRDLVQEYS